MSHKKKGHLTTENGWRKHLRPYGRRLFWKQHRMAEAKEAKEST